MAAYASSGYHRIRSVTLSEQYYREALENVASYNSRLCSERRQRLPFLDSQTGVAQNHSNLWIPYRYRGPGRSHGQIYSYPAQRWKKKCSLPLPDIPLPRLKPADTELSDPDVHAISANENTMASADSVDSKDIDEMTVGGSSLLSNSSVAGGQPAAYREEYYNDWENLSEPPDAGEIDQRNSDSSDYEETYVKRKVRRKDNKKRAGGPSAGGGGGASFSTGSTGRSRKKEQQQHRETEPIADRDKQYRCDLCGARYKTRPGLTYHMSHSHNKSLAADEELELAEPSPKHATAFNEASKRSLASATSKAAIDTGKYCDFCLGNESENKKTGTREEMVSCADCGRCGHPSCLQFTSNMIISVKKYPWQCIECKSCGMCGTSDNDDQLLFCDDCDRGYHMYCLNPPLSEPPEGSWSCHLCIDEFYGGQKPECDAEQQLTSCTSTTDTVTTAAAAADSASSPTNNP